MDLTQRELGDFRSEHLRPEAILGFIQEHVRVLLRLAVGVGKSLAADVLLRSALTYQLFQTVVYLAPTWRVIEEREFFSDPTALPVGVRLLMPRPRSLCGGFAERWEQLERMGCSALARKTLCKGCTALDEIGSPCGWPDRFKDLKAAGLVAATEQQVILNRGFIPFLQMITGGKRTLVVLDEAQFLDTDFTLVITNADLERFEGALSVVPGRTRAQKELIDRCLRSVRGLRCARSSGPDALTLDWPDKIHRFASAIQAAGAEAHGNEFRYIGYDLGLLRRSVRHERWRTSEGGVQFVARPYVNCHLLVLSANLTSEYVGRRLGTDSVASPFEGHRFGHTGTQVFNLRNRMGAEKRFSKTAEQILSTIAVLVLRNIHEGRSTVLVCRKKQKRMVSAFIEERLGGWGTNVRLVDEDYSTLPSKPEPSVVPVIHYGVVGINTFEEYESAYCVSSYYVSQLELRKRLRETEPQLSSGDLVIKTSVSGCREVQVRRGGRRDPALERVAGHCLQRLELDQVIQVAGRVRFVTRPREVLLFQQSDFSHEIPTVNDVRSIRALRSAMGIPAPRELDALVDAQKIEAGLTEGLTVEQAATRLGMSRRTAFSRLKQAKSATYRPYIRIDKGERLHSPDDGSPDRGGAA